MRVQAIWTGSLLVLAAVSRVSAQSQAVAAPAHRINESLETAVGDSAEPEWHGWVTASLGPAAGRPYQGIGGDLALWVTRNDWAIAVRRAATTGLFESTSNTYDTALLIGRRIPTPVVLNIVVGAGAGVIGTGGSGSTGHEATLAFGAQMLVNLYVVAVGFDAFASAGQTRRFIGFGATLGLGGFRRP